MMIRYETREYWKIAIVALFNEGSVFFVGKAHDASALSFFDQQIKKFIDSAHGSQTQEMVKDQLGDVAFDSLEDNELLDYQKNHMLFVLQDVVNRGYAKRESEKTSPLTGSVIEGARYSITKEGIEIAIKLMEHTDNERRHNTTVSNSRWAILISFVALVFAGITAYTGLKRLDLYEQQVLDMQKNQHAILKEVTTSKPEISKMQQNSTEVLQKKTETKKKTNTRLRPIERL